MPKMKTHSASKKRFSKTSSGKIKRARAFRRHHSWAKSANKVRDLRQGTFIHESHMKNFAILMPY